MVLEAGDRLLGSLPSVGLEKVDGGDLAQLLAQATRQVSDVGKLAVGVRTVEARRECTRLFGHARIILVAGGDEHPAQLGIAQPFDQLGFADQGLAAQLDDLTRQPGEVLLGLLVAGQRIDRVLDRHCTQRLKAPPHLDPGIGRLGRQLMNQQQPRGFGDDLAGVHDSPVPHCL
jgi:hypothetical protein